MYKYNNQRTGRCPYDTTNNMGELKWKYNSDCRIKYHPVIASDGTIYFYSECVTTRQFLFCAVNPDGTLKWQTDVLSLGFGLPLSTPVIGPDGTIYYGSSDNDLIALYPNGAFKWVYKEAEGETKNIFSSPAIGSDGTIYYGSSDNNLYALNPNGTLKWKYKTGGDVIQPPAIGNDGTIYFGSDDDNLYALNPDGTLKWKYKYKTSNIRNGPVIAPNGKIYIISNDDYLYQIELSGEWVWKKKLNILTSNICSISDISIGSDGILYFGLQEPDDSYITAFDPELRNYKWKKSLGKYACINTPILSREDTIYFATFNAPNDFYAIYPDGNIKWKYKISDDKYDIPGYAISSDGTIYVTSRNNYLYAFGWYIKLNSPNGGEKWETGKTYQIKWNTSSTGGYVKIYYSLNSGSTWNKITCISNNNTVGSYNWTIPSNINTDKARIKVEYTDSCQDNSKVYESDISENDFT
ncbi:MAG: PQQ-binding-like beta-propeller repeat protein, partial [Caldisericia bacterium]|nr:PQQ-binding-like beta-propeller repeat protein [Caldisericia bacterium]